MRITKVYTRTGDRGTTRLVGGEEVPKDTLRIETYGTVDELNAILGLARTFQASVDVAAEARSTLDGMLAQLQNDLFNLGADFATPAASRWEGMILVQEADWRRLEGWIDTLNEDLPPLKEFILPGGGPVGAFLHQARTVCRRAERHAVSLTREDDTVSQDGLIYLNRLSDLLFVMSRWAAKALGEPEYTWQKPSR